MFDTKQEAVESITLGDLSKVQLLTLRFKIEEELVHRRFKAVQAKYEKLALQRQPHQQIVALYNAMSRYQLYSALHCMSAFVDMLEQCEYYMGLDT